MTHLRHPSWKTHVSSLLILQLNAEKVLVPILCSSAIPTPGRRNAEQSLSLQQIYCPEMPSQPPERLWRAPELPWQLTENLPLAIWDLSSRVLLRTRNASYKRQLRCKFFTYQRSHLLPEPSVVWRPASLSHLLSLGKFITNKLETLRWSSRSLLLWDTWDMNQEGTQQPTDIFTCACMGWW